MTITPEAPAKTLTQLVATEIKVQMARSDVRQSQLARSIGKTEQWLSVRLRGRQPIDLNDLMLIAQGLNVGVHDLLPSPEAAARTVGVQATASYEGQPVRRIDHAPVLTGRPRDNRPSGHPRDSGTVRTARLPRERGPK